MRLLVTRPEPDAELTAEALRAVGHQVLVQPLLTITFLPPPLGLPLPAALVVTSQNGVRALGHWPDAANWRRVPVFTAGPATAHSVMALGFSDVRTGAEDAASLADVVAAGFDRKAGPILYPAARDRMGTLGDSLTARGYDLRIVEAYRAEPAKQLDAVVRAAFEESALDGVLLYSRRTAMALIDLATAAGIGGDLADPAYYVISAAVGEVVQAVAARIHVAAHPDENSLIALIPAP